MTIHSFNLLFIWLLPVTAGGAVITPHHSFADVMTDNVTINPLSHSRATIQEIPNLNAFATPSFTVDVKPTEKKNNSTLPITQMPSERISPDNQKTANQAIFTLPQLKTSPGEVMSTTDKQFQVTRSATTVVTNRDSNPTTTTRLPPVFSSFTQSTIKGDKNTHGSTQPISTRATSIEPTDKTTSAVTVGDAKQSSTLYRSSPATTKISIIHIRTTKKSTTVQKSNQGLNPSNVVAGIIGGALVLMMVAFLIIFIKKRHVKKQQINTSDWAGPSPFLQDGADTGNVTLRSSNQISIISFLPQRLSKRFSAITESQQELHDFIPGTFGDKRQGDTAVHQVHGSDVKESKETAATVDLEVKTTADRAETVPVPSSQTNSHI